MSAQANQKFCTTCGKPIHEKAEICPHCGVRQPMMAAGSDSKGRNKLTAGLLGIILGGIGIHKFYLGQNGIGLIYLLFSWTFIPVIVGFVEGIMLLLMSDADFDSKYNAPTQ
jgi:TM2 domain-containing membrane protein YozV